MTFIIIIGIAIIFCFLISRIDTEEVEWTDDDSIEQLVSDLHAMRVITGLSYHEREIIDKTIAYIKKAESNK